MSKAQSVVTVPCKYKTGKVLGQGTYAVVKGKLVRERGGACAIGVLLVFGAVILLEVGLHGAAFAC